jgi:hypothetical protein
VNIEGVQDFFLTLSRDSWCPGVAEFDTRAVHASSNSPGVELGGTGSCLALLCG